MGRYIIHLLEMIFMSAIIMSCGNRTQLYNVEGLLSDTARYIIDLDHVEKEYIINMSSYFDSMEIIPLETRKDVLLGRIRKYRKLITICLFWINLFPKVYWYLKKRSFLISYRKARPRSG